MTNGPVSGSTPVSRRQHGRISKAVDAWADAELDDARARSVAAHVQHCWDCSSAAQTARLVKRSLRRLRDREPPGLAAARPHRFAERLLRR